MWLAMNNINLSQSLSKAALCMLLLLYSLAALKVDSFHELFHAEELKELHSAEHENNPCHKSIYHQQAEPSCEHKSHITENTKCPLCECNISLDQLLSRRSDVINIDSISTLELFTSTDLITAAQFVSADRGPPAIV